MAAADYRFPTRPPEENYNTLGELNLYKMGLSRDRMSGKTPQERDAQFRAKARAEGQLIKESRDPRKEIAAQQSRVEMGKAQADKALEDAVGGTRLPVSSRPDLPPSAEDFFTGPEWEPSPYYSSPTFVDRTGKVQNIPGGRGVYSETREVLTPEGGMVRQVAGGKGFGSTTFSDKQVKKMAEDEAARIKRAEQFATGMANLRQAGLSESQKELSPKLEEYGIEVPYTKEGEFDVAKAKGAISEAKRQGWESDKLAYAEGQQVQRESARQLSNINRLLTNEGRRIRKGGQPTISAEQYQDMLDQKAQLQAAIGRREGLSKKGVTRLGYEAERNRRERMAAQEALRKAAQAGFEGYKTKGAAAKAQLESADPWVKTIQSLLDTFGLGLNSK